MTATTTSPDAASRLFTPAFIALSLAELAYFTAAGLTIPVTPLLAHGPLGADPSGVGLAVGLVCLYALVQAHSREESRAREIARECL